MKHSNGKKPLRAVTKMHSQHIRLRFGVQRLAVTHQCRQSRCPRIAAIRDSRAIEAVIHGLEERAIWSNSSRRFFPQNRATSLIRWPLHSAPGRRVNVFSASVHREAALLRSSEAPVCIRRRRYLAPRVPGKPFVRQNATLFEID